MKNECIEFSRPAIQRKAQQLWDDATIEGTKCSLTNIIKQGGKQRLSSLKKETTLLTQVSTQMASTATCVAMRASARSLVLAEISTITPADSKTKAHSPPSQSLPLPHRTITHVDWGAATGAFARSLKAEIADRTTPSMMTISIHSRSFDILPAGPEVEFADMAAPPSDLAIAKLSLCLPLWAAR